MPQPLKNPLSEQWRPFRDTGYHVSDYGRVKGKHGKVLRPAAVRPGWHLKVSVMINGKKNKCLYTG